MRMPALTLGVLVLVLGAQVLCSPESPTKARNPHEESSISAEENDTDSTHIEKRAARDFEFGLGKKRAYTYVSEFKRPPVYNFGLGKRSGVANDFGSDDKSSFAPDDDMWISKLQATRKLIDDSSDIGNYNSYGGGSLSDDNEDGYGSKRSPYEFGLGKKSSYEFGLGKRSPYEFGLGRRSYEFGLGKRSPYEFGLGKRSPYEFGLGKRSPYEFGLGKRTPYEFGLGKRSPYEFGLGKRTPYEFGLGKRSPYEFGLGKRSPYEFGLGKRSPYEFGLGKRSPYEFGLGKKSLEYGEKSEWPEKRLATYKQWYDMGRKQRDLNRFNFGLGKRNAPSDAPSDAPDDELYQLFNGNEEHTDEELSS